MGSNPIPSTSPRTVEREYYVYILQSLTSGRFYVGHCDHLIERFHEHQSGYSKATRNRGPWWMPYYETYPTRQEAQRREYAIKRMKSASHIRRLIREQFPPAAPIQAAAPQ